MRKLLIPACWLVLGVALLSCGGSSSSGGGTHTSGIAYRAFVSNSVSAGTASAGLYIVNAMIDVHPLSLAPIAAGNTPGMMVVTPNRAQTLVYSGYNTQNPDNQLTIITNASETASGRVTLPGYTESFIVSPDSSTAYVAVPAPKTQIVNQSPGLIKVIGLSSGTFSGEIDIPSVHYLSMNNEGTRILAFSSSADITDTGCSSAAPCFLSVVTPSNLNTENPVFTPIPSDPATNSLDHPVAAFFSSDDTTAYIVNCGAECGGTQASVQPFDMTTNTPGAPTLVPAGSVALVQGSTMYLAGTPYANGPSGGPSQACTGQTTAATTCGVLTILDLNTMQSVQPPNCPTGEQCPIIITDGYHNRIEMGAYGQLFIGASTCTEIIPPQPPLMGAEVRGCLSIFNTHTTSIGNVAAGGVVIAPANGNVTGIQPISTRSVVYVVQGNPTPGGSLYIYCTANSNDNNCPSADALQIAPVNEPSYAPLMVGNFFDVKTVDF